MKSSKLVSALLILPALIALAMPVSGPLYGSTRSQQTQQAQQTQPTWQDTGLPWPPHDSIFCMDGEHPHVFFANEASSGTVAYDWVTKNRTVINQRVIDVCGPRGLLFARTEQGALRYSLDDPVGRAIEQMPTHVARDGSLIMYSFPVGDPKEIAEHYPLWFSSDGGLTWQRQPIPAGWLLLNIAVSEANAQALYAQVSVSGTGATGGSPGGPGGAGGSQGTQGSQGVQNAPAGIFYALSLDAGQTWTWQVPKPNDPPSHSDTVDQVAAMPGPTAPLNMVLRSLTYRGGFSQGGGLEAYLSSDAGHNFQLMGNNDYGYRLVMVYTLRGIVRLHWTRDDPASNLERSSDGGKTWTLLRRPEIGVAASGGVPGSLFLEGGRYSTDSGDHWQDFPDYTDRGLWYYYSQRDDYTPYRLDVTPYLPLSLLGSKDLQHLSVLDLPVSIAGVKAPALPDHSPGNQFFPETGHNVQGTFLRYWQTHGGLAQQGYPITEPFQMVSDVDGKVYKMQFFERAVFELHPENKPPNDVLLSLLGVQAYKQKYGPTGAPNQHVSTDNPRYFPETGHTIGGKFRAYWDSHGGLAQQGYPISEEFEETSPLDGIEETSPLDGKSYRVQYFQRAVFEWHPENAGTPYEVLLSQLGTLKANQLGTQAPNTGPESPTQTPTPLP